MITSMKNGWRNHCSEGPADLYDKSGWQVWQTSDMDHWRVEKRPGGPYHKFPTLEKAMAFVDDAVKSVPDANVPERFMSEVGLNTGLVDMHDKPIHLGDTIWFDRREWGDDNNTFVIGFSDGELDIKGTVDDARSWWTVIKKWNDK